MRLNLGCADDIRAGYVNVDFYPPADELVDLSVAPWPWGDSSAEEVVARDILEHLPDKRQTMNELWRVLQDGGRAVIELPCAAHGAGAFQDPTHRSFWTANDFEYYEKGNFARERFRGTYGIAADFRVIGMTHRRYDGKWDEVWKITAILEAIK